MVVFVYGKAMRGGPEHELLTGCRYLGRGRVQGKAITLVDGQPLAIPGEVMWGEAYAVPVALEDQLLSLMESRDEQGLDWEDVMATVDGFSLRCTTLASSASWGDVATSANYRVRPSFPNQDRRRFERGTECQDDCAETNVLGTLTR